MTGLFDFVSSLPGQTFDWIRAIVGSAAMAWAVIMISVLPILLIIRFLWSPTWWAMRNVFSLLILEPIGFVGRWMKKVIKSMKAWDDWWNPSRF